MDDAKKAVHNPVQHPAAQARTASQTRGQTTGQSGVCERMRGDAIEYNGYQVEEMGDTGLEPVTSRV